MTIITNSGATIEPNENGGYCLDTNRTVNSRMCKKQTHTLCSGQKVDAQQAYDAILKAKQDAQASTNGHELIEFRGSIIRLGNDAYIAGATLVTGRPWRTGKRTTRRPATQVLFGQKPSTNPIVQGLRNETPTNGIITRADGLFEAA